MRFQRFSVEQVRAMYLWAKSSHPGNQSPQTNSDLDEVVSKVLTRLDKEDAAERMVTYCPASAGNGESVPPLR